MDPTLGSTVTVNTVTVGALLRRDFRAFLDTLGVQWVECKGLLESVFIVTAPTAQWAQLNAVIAAVEG